MAKVESSLCSYLNVSQAVRDAHKLKDWLLVALRIVSYFTVIIPLICGITYLAAWSWNKKVTPKSPQDPENAKNNVLDTKKSATQIGDVENANLDLMKKPNDDDSSQDADLNLDTSPQIMPEPHNTKLDLGKAFPNPFPNPQDFSAVFFQTDPNMFFKIKQFCNYLRFSSELPVTPHAYNAMLKEFIKNALKTWPKESLQHPNFIRQILIPIFNFQIVKGCEKGEEQCNIQVLNDGVSTLREIEERLETIKDISISIPLYALIVDTLQLLISSKDSQKHLMERIEEDNLAFTQGFLTSTEKKGKDWLQRASKGELGLSDDIVKQLKEMQENLNKCFEDS